MNLYFITWRSNYGDQSAVIEAESREKCMEICNNSDQIWSDYSIDLITLTGSNQILYIN